MENSSNIQTRSALQGETSKTPPAEHEYNHEFECMPNGRFIVPTKKQRFSQHSQDFSDSRNTEPQILHKRKPRTCNYPVLEKILNSSSLELSELYKMKRGKKHPSKSKRAPGKKKAKAVKKPVGELTVMEKQYHCTECSAAFTYQKDLRRHSVVHSGEKPHICQVCSKAYSRSDKLMIHMRTHSGFKPFKCDQCNFATTDGSSLKKHKATHLKEKKLRPYKCQLCEYAATCSYNLSVHLRTHTGDQPYTCHKCKSRFKVKSDLNRHLKMHEKKEEALKGEEDTACSTSLDQGGGCMIIKLYSNSVLNSKTFIPKKAI